MEDYYRGKTVLITGATGFVGKAILWQLLKQAGSVIDKVYVLIRPKRVPMGSPSQRLLDEIINTHAFRKLLVEHFDNDREFFQNKLVPVSYDLSLPHMGLSMQDSQSLRSSQIVIHCAATSEYESSLEWNLETNVLGTIRLMDYLDSCDDVCSFIHLSPAHIYQELPEGSVDASISEYVYDIGFGDPEAFLKELLAAEEKELAALIKRILQKYSTLHLFTKALVEHLVIRRMEQMRDQQEYGGKQPYPLAIFRSNYLGPSLQEPSPGWTSGVSGISSWLALYGYAIPIIQPDQGSRPANIVPVDYAASSIVRAIPQFTYPGDRFVLPLVYNVNNLVHTGDGPTINFFPYIYHIAIPKEPISWYSAYVAIQDYWSRPNHQLTTSDRLPTAEQYFSSNKTLSKARFLMQYYFRSTPTATAPPPVPALPSSFLLSPSSSSSSLPSTLSQKRASQRASMLSNSSGSVLYSSSTSFATKPDLFQQNDHQKWMELASNIRNNLTRQNKYQWKHSSDKFHALLGHHLDDLNQRFSKLDWYNYFLQSCHGVHVHTMHGGPHLRSIIMSSQTLCALYSSVRQPDSVSSIIDAPFRSVVYTEEEMRQRIQHMINITISSLKNPIKSIQEEKQWKPIWIEYLNDTLEDWCDEGSTSLKAILQEKQDALQHWKLRVEENAESAKVTVLNDARVIEAIKQLSKRSGMPEPKVMEEAARSFNRIQERTQLPYAWFAASFLQKVLKNMFSGIYIDQRSLEKIRMAIDNSDKQVVYVPLSKTALDPILVWYLAIRYRLPIPALVLDEALAILGPFSDLLRLAGAVFIKRDPHARSGLTTAVTSAYLQYLLQERGALTLSLDQMRSRTGIFKTPYQDGLLDMIKDNKDALFVPINITYEETPDLALLIEQDLQMDKQQISRPSDSRSHRVRSRSLGNGFVEERTHSPLTGTHLGRLLIGIGLPVPTMEDATVLAQRIQEGQKQATFASSISLVAAILLHSRINGNCIDLETMKDHLKYLLELVKLQGYFIDWQEYEDTENIIFYNIRLLEKCSNSVSIDERSNSFMFRISTRSENILQLAYYANQLREIFVLDSIFSATYLSFGTRTRVFETAFLERFELLTTLLQHQFNSTWNIRLEYNTLRKRYKDYIREAQNATEEGREEDNDEGVEVEEDGTMLERLVTKVSNSKQYSHLTLLASFVYPIIDSFWVTLCALSALNDVRVFPITLVPTLSQWIGMHLISGRRTIYSEVLSKEYSQNTLQSLVLLGVLDQKPAKLVLSPDAQMLMQALGLSTNDDVVLQAEKDKDDEAVALDSIAELCKKIEQVRLKEEDVTGSVHIYEKCQNQIKSLAKTTDSNSSFSKRHGAIVLEQKEEAMAQLGYALIQSMDTIL
ncbi:male sterility protein-domain-containing protein [Choanephora cucurbitarum]|nr:male sterility protein-domain-containing protein [Choanephora cucurbitarum]